jgi:NDP-sugar pyrophosphorylase family protein
VSGSVLWEGASVGRGARVGGSILATGARVGESEQVEREVVLPARPGKARRVPLSKTGKK